MRKDDMAPWYIVARRLIPWILLQPLFALSWVLIVIGWGFGAAADFAETVWGY